VNYSITFSRYAKGAHAVQTITTANAIYT